MLFNAYELEQHTRQRQLALQQQAERRILARPECSASVETAPAAARRMSPAWLRRKLAIR
jgi:hypothetical protein